jgi:hypothetical protein
MLNFKVINKRPPISKKPIIKRKHIDDFYIVNERKVRECTLKHEVLHKLQETRTFSKSNKLTFIHPTKCGGTTVENFMHENYRKYFQLNKAHGQSCLNHNNPVMIVRDPIDRFKSMFKFWKYGSRINRRSESFLNKYKNVTVKQFIQFIKNDKKEHLFGGVTWDVHIKPITHWIKNTKLYNIIILKYQKNLDNSVQKLLEIMKIPSKNVHVPYFNVSSCKENVILDDEDIQFIKEYYRSDYDLWEKINEHPYLFRVVI